MDWLKAPCFWNTSPLRQGSDVSTQAKKGHDSAVDQREEDDLDRWNVARSVHRTISTTPGDWSTRIGLYGEWGSGKTSVLNFLKQIAEADGDIVVSFSAWSATGDGGVIALFYEELIHSLQANGVKRPLKTWAKKIGKKITDSAARLGDLTAKGGSASGNEVGEIAGAFGIIFAASAGALGAKLTVTDADLRELQNLLGSRKVIVFIDDLDRADPKLVPKTLLALRELLDWPGFAFILAFDKNIIASALVEYSKAYGESAQHFLDKIIDVPFELPQPTTHQSSKLALSALEKCCNFMPTASMLAVAKYFPANPRQSKLIARSIGILRDVALRHDEVEISWEALTLQTVLRHTAPKTASIIEKEIIGYKSDDFTNYLPTTQEIKDQLQITIKNAIEKTSGTDDTALFNYLLTVTTALRLARASHTASKIEYEMNLLSKEPCLTWKEYRELVATWTPKSDLTLIPEALSTASERGNSTTIEAANELIEKVISSYSSNLGRVYHSGSKGEAAEHLARVFHELSFLEMLWNSEIEALCDTTSLLINADKMREEFSRWVPCVWFDSVSDGELRSRELKLMKLAAEKCEDKIDLFFKTEPVEDSYRHIPENRKAMQNWYSAIREPLIPIVVDKTVGLFTTPQGVLITASHEELNHSEHRFTWVLESQNSPLYSIEAYKHKLIDFLRASTARPDESGVVSRNSLDYLRLVFGLLRNSSYCKNPKFFLEFHLELIIAAWNCATGFNYHDRTKGAIAELHQAITAHEIDVSEIVLPTWVEDITGQNLHLQRHGSEFDQ